MSDAIVEPPEKKGRKTQDKKYKACTLVVKEGLGTKGTVIYNQLIARNQTEIVSDNALSVHA